jgi:hypothetical protein
VPCAHELTGGGLGEEEHRLQVDVDDVVPVLLAELDGVFAADDAGVVDQDVHVAAELPRLG